jgi:hypothetical protein
LKRPTLLIFALLPCVATAALAPVHQNPKDLSVMVAFVLSHTAVVQSLRTIDFENRTVHFGKDCVAKFGRTEAPTRPGPAAPLEFKSSNCPVGQAK